MSRQQPAPRSVRSGIDQPTAIPDSQQELLSSNTTVTLDNEIMQIARVQWGRMFPRLSQMSDRLIPARSISIQSSPSSEETQENSTLVSSVPHPTVRSPVSQRTSQQSPELTLTKATCEWRKLLSGYTVEEREILSHRPIVLSTENMKHNEYWGDLLGQKEESHTRIYSINVNGISVDRRGGTFDDICRTVKEVQADVLCLQEHNLDTTKPKIRSMLFDAANQHWKRNRIAIATTPITFEAAYKPGGTMIMTVDNLTGRVVNQIRDKWGRWTIQEFTGKDKTRVIIVSAYQPVENSNGPGKTTVAAQQQSLLIMTQDPLQNPRTAFRRDLLKTLQEYRKSANTSILLVGDFNEQFGVDPDGMEKLAASLQLMDLMASRHSSAHPATYARGTKRLDYALASSHVCDALRASGYEEFNSRIASDHRGYYFDFDTEMLFGSQTQPLESPTKRGLTSANVRQVTKYIREKYRILEEHNVFSRAEKLLYPEQRHAFAERLDKDVLDASLQAETLVGRFGSPAWSIELAEARQRVSILTKQLSFLRTGYDNREKLQHAIARLQEPFELPKTILDCSKALRDAKYHTRNIVSQSFQRRDEERQRKIEMLEASAKDSDKKTATRLRRLKKAEDIKNLFDKLRHVRTNTKRQGVTRIEIPLHPEDDPKQCSEWRQVEVPTEVLRLLQERNRMHFGQAHGTPFTVSPLQEDLGFCGDGPAAAEILAGKYHNDELDKNVKILLSHMAHVREMAESPEYPTITDGEFCSKLKVWTETTTTSPSGLHLGHYKALIARHEYSFDASDDQVTAEMAQLKAELDSKQAAMRAVHLTLINYALEQGYSYRRWQTIANTILFKDADNVRLHRTRVIHIYEADYNLILGIKWRMATYQAEAFKALNEGQYGSRPRRNATDPVFLEELQCEVSRATRRPVVLTNYDATACYDRIIPNVASLVSQKFGVHPKVVKANMETLQRAEYRIRTDMGLAPTGYSHTPEFPIYGTGQGSANSPAIWCFLSSCLFDSYEDVAYPATYATPDGGAEVSLNMVGFVDDCNGQTNQFHEPVTGSTITDLLDQTAHNAQNWSDLLHASGGALELSKCSCQVVDWWFTDHGEPLLAPKDSSHQDRLMVSDRSTGTKHKLQLLSPYQSHKTLGHYKDPAGTQNEQFRRLMEKSTDQVSFLWSCPLTRLEAWTFYHACYLPSVGYPLANSSLTRNQLEQVQRKAMSIIIPRCGYNRTTKKEILYGPLELGGACFRDLYVQQGIGQIGLFMRNWRSGTTAGKLLRIAVSWFQLQVGTSVSILADVKTNLPHLESKWLASLRTFLAFIDSSLQLDTDYVPPCQREYDASIMDIVLQNGKFTDDEIKRLNYCRLYLQAHTLSDLTNINGYTLDETKLEGAPSLQSSRTHSGLINQRRPSDSEWYLWQKANLLWSDPTGRLLQPLGAWTCPINEQRQRHAAYWTNTMLWVRVEDHYVRAYTTGFCETLFFDSQEKSTWEEIDRGSHPADAMYVSPGIWQVYEISTFHRPPLIQRAKACPPYTASLPTFDHYIETLDDWEVNLLQHFELFADPFSVGLSLSQGIRAVSDGSVWIKRLGAFGWALSDMNGVRLAEGMGPAPGATPTSYRSEAYGMLAIFCFLRRLSEFIGHRGDPWEGILATDSLSLLDTLRGVKIDDVPSGCEEMPESVEAPLDPMSAEWDVVGKISSLLSDFPQMVLKHVRGHQDRKVQYQSLSLLSQLNVDADRLANRFQSEYGEARPVAYLIEGTGVHLITPQGTVTSKYASAIRHQATYEPLIKYLRIKHGWSPYVSDRINWKAHGASLKKNIKHQQHYVKLVQGILPTNHQVYRHDPMRRGCPLCSCRDETWTHIVRCPHPSRVKWRKDFCTDVRSQCSKLQTKPELVEILIQGLTGWLEWAGDAEFELPADLYEDEYRRLILSQNSIGWKHVFMGRFSNDWAAHQDDFYFTNPGINPKKRRSGERWQVALIGVVWESWYEVWKARNQDVHGADATQKATIERRDVLRSLRVIYDKRRMYEPSSQELLMKDIRDHEGHTTRQLKNWLAINEPVFQISFRRAKKAAIAGMKSIRHYFSSASELMRVED